MRDAAKRREIPHTVADMKNAQYRCSLKTANILNRALRATNAATQGNAKIIAEGRFQGGRVRWQSEFCSKWRPVAGTQAERSVLRTAQKNNAGNAATALIIRELTTSAVTPSQ